MPDHVIDNGPAAVESYRVHLIYHQIRVGEGE
jgi:hypothetical protein